MTQETMMTADFETKKIQMETLPEYLRAARENLSYTVRHVSKITGISEKFLEDLENGYYHRLPADVYVYGFLRKLGELYRADAEILIHQFKKERGIQANLNKTAKETKSYQPSKFEITPKTITASVLVFFVVFVLGYLFYQVHAINRAPELDISAPLNGDHVTSSSIIVQGKTDVGASVTINDQQILVDSDGNFKQPVSISPGDKVLTFVSKNNFGKSTSKQIVVYGDFQTQDQSAQNAATTAAAKSNPLTLEVDIGPNSTWLTVKIDDQPEHDETFIAGSSKTYTAQDKIVLSTGDGGSTVVKLNGKDLGKLGRDGEVIRDIPFTADSVNTK